MRLSSLAFLEGFYYKPRIDKEILERHAEGLICLSGCASSEFSDLLLHDLGGAMEEVRTDDAGHDGLRVRAGCAEAVMQKRPDYGIDSPAIVVAEAVLGAAGLGAAGLLHVLRASALLWAIALAVGSYFLLNALGMIRYSRSGKLRLREGALDAALIALPADAIGVTAVGIYDEDFVLALPPGHPLAGKRRVPAAALAQLPLLLLDEGHCLRDQALDVCHKAGVQAELANTRAASLATAVQCVTGGLGVTLIPQSAVPVEAARSRLGLAQFAAPRPGRRIGLVFRSSSGRDESYRQLAGVLGKLIAREHHVRPVK